MSAERTLEDVIAERDRLLVMRDDRRRQLAAENDRLRAELREANAMLDMWALREQIPPGQNALYFASLCAAHRLNDLIDAQARS